MRAVRARQREKKLAKIDRKALETESSGKLKISLCVNAILVVCVVAMFAMTLTSDSPTIVDYQSKLLNRYASWEQELTEREKAVSEKEQELGTTDIRQPAGTFGGTAQSTIGVSCNFPDILQSITEDTGNFFRQYSTGLGGKIEGTVRLFGQLATGYGCPQFGEDVAIKGLCTDGIRGNSRVLYRIPQYPAEVIAGNLTIPCGPVFGITVQ